MNTLQENRDMKELMNNIMPVLIGALFLIGFLLVMGAVSTETLSITEMVSYGAAGLLAMLLSVVLAKSEYAEDLD
jgi:hypothetical protein